MICQFRFLLLKIVVRGFNLHVVELEGFEADDLIGTFARIAEAKGFSVVMVTGDKDFMQLVTENRFYGIP